MVSRYSQNLTRLQNAAHYACQHAWEGVLNKFIFDSSQQFCYSSGLNLLEIKTDSRDVHNRINNLDLLHVD